MEARAIVVRQATAGPYNTEAGENPPQQVILSNSPVISASLSSAVPYNSSASGSLPSRAPNSCGTPCCARIVRTHSSACGASDDARDALCWYGLRRHLGKLRSTLHFLSPARGG